MKKLLILSVVAVMAAGVYFTINSSLGQKSDLVSKNIEALSNGEGGVSRNCGLIWGKGCYADNYGAHCEGQGDCSN